MSGRKAARRSTLTPTQAASGFGCPCHGGQYDTEGNRDGRPAGARARPLPLPDPRRPPRPDRAVLASARSTARARMRSSTRTTGSTRASTSTAWRRSSTRSSRRTDGDRGASPQAKGKQQQLVALLLYPLEWLEERSGLVGGVKWFLFRKVPRDSSWWHTLGSATLTAFLVQAGTGVILAMYYKPDPDKAYAVDPAHHERPDARLARPRHAPLGRERLHHPDVLPHGARVPVRRVQVPARAELARRRGAC